LSPCLLVSLSLFASGCDDYPGKPKEADRYVAPQKEMKFEVLYQQNCAGCHGADGQWGPAPPLNDKLFLSLIPEKELLRVITEGRKLWPSTTVATPNGRNTTADDTLMPAWAVSHGGQLIPEQVKVLAEGIKKNWGSLTPGAEEAPPYVATQTKSGSPENGLKVFNRACSSCHGDNGEGGSVGPINNRVFLALISDQALRRIIITGRSDLGMPNYRESKGRPEGFKPLTDQDVTDLVALLDSWREGKSVNGKGK